MANFINNYESDSNINDNDKIIGTDVVTGDTVNFRIGDLREYLTTTISEDFALNGYIPVVHNGRTYSSFIKQEITTTTYGDENIGSIVADSIYAQSDTVLAIGANVDIFSDSGTVANGRLLLQNYTSGIRLQSKIASVDTQARTITLETPIPSQELVFFDVNGDLDTTVEIIKGVSFDIEIPNSDINLGDNGILTNSDVVVDGTTSITIGTHTFTPAGGGDSIPTIEVGEYRTQGAVDVQVNNLGHYGAFFNPSNGDGIPVLFLTATSGDYNGGPGILTVDGTEYAIPPSNIRLASESGVINSLTYQNGNAYADTIIQIRDFYELTSTNQAYWTDLADIDNLNIGGGGNVNYGYNTSTFNAGAFQYIENTTVLNNLVVNGAIVNDGLFDGDYNSLTNRPTINPHDVVLADTLSANETLTVPAQDWLLLPNSVRHYLYYNHGSDFTITAPSTGYTLAQIADFLAEDGTLTLINRDEVLLTELGSSNTWQERLELIYGPGQIVNDFTVQNKGNVTTGLITHVDNANVYQLPGGVTALAKPDGETDAVYLQRFTVNSQGDVDSLTVTAVSIAADGVTSITLSGTGATVDFTITYPPANFGAVVGASVRDYGRRVTPAPVGTPTDAQKLELRPATAEFAFDETLGVYVSDYWILQLINGQAWRPYQVYVEGDEVEYLDSQGVPRHVFCRFPHTSSAATNPDISSTVLHSGIGFDADSPWEPVGASIDLSTGTNATAVQLMQDKATPGTFVPAVVFGISNSTNPNDPQTWTVIVGDGIGGTVELEGTNLPLVNDLISFGTGNLGTSEEYRIKTVGGGAITSLTFLGTIPPDVRDLFDSGLLVNIFDAGDRTDFGQVDRLVFNPIHFTVNTEAQNIGHAHISVVGATAPTEGTAFPTDNLVLGQEFYLNADITETTPATPYEATDGTQLSIGVVEAGGAVHAFSFAQADNILPAELDVNAALDIDIFNAAGNSITITFGFNPADPNTYAIEAFVGGATGQFDAAGFGVGTEIFTNAAVTTTIFTEGWYKYIDGTWLPISPGAVSGGAFLLTQDGIEAAITDDAGFRAEIGAGTSSLAVGTSSTDALRGDALTDTTATFAGTATTVAVIDRTDSDSVSNLQFEIIANSGTPSGAGFITLRKDT